MRRSEIQRDFYLFPRPRKTGKPIFYVQLRDPVSRKVLTARSSALTNRTAAEKWARREFDKLSESARHPPLLLREWAGRFFVDGCPHVDRLRLEGKHYSDRVRHSNRRVLELYLLPDPLMGSLVARVRRPDVLAFRDRVIARLGRCRQAQVVMAVLRIILREARFRELTDADPFLGVGLIRYEEQVRGALSSAAVRLLLERERWEDEVHWLATWTAASTGLRAGEVRALQWRDLDLARHVILVRRNLPGESTVPDLPKWQKVRTCPYPGSLAALLEPCRGPPGSWVFSRGSGPIGYKRWAEALRVVARGAQMPEATLHILRHSLNTALRGAGHADELLRGAFGWASPDVQESYTHRDGYDYSGLAAEIDRFLGRVE